MFATDLDYWSHRAEREAVAAAATGDGQAAAIHHELSRHYARRVMAELIERRVAFPFERGG